MSVLNLDAEIVGSHYDPQTRMNYYTVERDGKRWTVEIHTDELDKHGFGPGHKQRRQNHLANALLTKMRGPHDAEIEAAKAKDAEAQQDVAE